MSSRRIDSYEIAHGVDSMAIYRLIANGTFGPAEIKAMTTAYEGALVDLHLIYRDDAVTEVVATSIVTEVVATAIVAITSTGERDPMTIKDRALIALGVRASAA
jgi:hypothetical protein